MTLPRLSIQTAHSKYLIDQNAGTYIRVRVSADANDLSNAGIYDGEPVHYQKIVSGLEVGQSLVITHGDGTWIRSTPIQNVTEIA